MIDRKLTADELENVNGGRQIELGVYCNELYAKYGIERGDIDSLMKVCTNTELAKIRRLKTEIVSQFLFNIKKPED